MLLGAFLARISHKSPNCGKIFVNIIYQILINEVGLTATILWSFLPSRLRSQINRFRNGQLSGAFFNNKSIIFRWTLPTFLICLLIPFILSTFRSTKIGDVFRTRGSRWSWGRSLHRKSRNSFHLRVSIILSTHRFSLICLRHCLLDRSLNHRHTF